MGMSVGGSNRGIVSEMNVVPLIDVLLVLLVIFMIIPHKQTGLRVEIPQPAPHYSAPPQTEPDITREVELARVHLEKGVTRIRDARDPANPAANEIKAKLAALAQ